MKKTLAFLLTLSMLLTLSACGKADGGQLGETPARVVSRGLFVLDDTLDLSGEGTVNQLLHQLGASCGRGQYEFDSLELHKYRHMPVE